ncbi:bifunctional 2',3'-cyclic-nucleotide 2'-phosphodiesterase/3'-nucleotidase [Paenibacillus kribbensis]|uniref:bifunctional 2',3'-cyclic-nucleotide 2'-phosphodiesterase/3'-nucleotidase n=1 Tax=Paenibacillus kribbensis TaxID=172713 RepID=UPI0015BDFF11|nr:bifunctional 2',3'-cyclic-nucleotide 2'-phosphodiesterase/3'-nucleotidase [Paenibacillus kribbensis]
METNEVICVETSGPVRVKFRIMVTTDLHVSLWNYDYYADEETLQYGLAQTASLIQTARSEVPNHLLLDNGDVIQGNPMGDYAVQRLQQDPSAVHPAYKAMNLLGYEAGNIGNHEFNYGLEYLQTCLQGAQFPYINANIYVAGENEQNYFTPYLLLDKTVEDEAGGKHLLKVGVIGFVPPQIMQWDKAWLEGKIIVKDVLETARRFIPKMRAEGADLIIAMPHAGFEDIPETPYMENTVLPLSRVEGIDAILFGHAHKVFPGPSFVGKTGVDTERGTIHEIPAVEPGFWGDHLGIIDLDLFLMDGKWEVAASSAEVRPVYDPVRQEALVQPDAEIQLSVAEEHAGTLEYIRAPVGRITVAVNSFFAQVMDDASVQLVNDAQIWYVKQQMQGSEYEDLPVLSAAAPFKTGGRYGPSYYTDIPAGMLAIKHIADLYNFPNTLHVVRLTGAEIREWLEWSAGQFRQIDPLTEHEQELIDSDFPSFNFDIIDGIRYQIDVTQPARYDIVGKLKVPDAHRILHMSYEGEPMDMQRSYLVVTNNYRAFTSTLVNPGGERIVLAAPDENRHVLTEYVRHMKTLAPKADGHWSLVPWEGRPHVTFLSSPQAIKAAQAYPELLYEGLTIEGYAKFAIDFGRL